jgi:hypothetical protein
MAARAQQMKKAGPAGPVGPPAKSEAIDIPGITIEIFVCYTRKT